MRHFHETAYSRARLEAAFMRAFKFDDWSKRGCTCAYCRDRIKRDDVTGDHVQPRAKGGATHRKNIRSSCRSCNQLKAHHSEKAFKNMLAHPPSDAPFPLLLAHVRRRLNLRTERAVKRIKRYVGAQ